MQPEVIRGKQPVICTFHIQSVAASMIFPARTFYVDSFSHCELCIFRSFTGELLVILCSCGRRSVAGEERFPFKALLILRNCLS